MDIIDFQTTIWNYYQKNKREFEWRKTSHPYHILVSEIMLQQTQTSRVVSKYNQFLTTFPTLKDLAQANFGDVLKVWSGLGYNRRAKYLHAIAQKIVNEFDGVFPQDAKVLELFPGLGKATAASIVVFSTNQPIPFIETNIRRVFIHFFFPNQDNISDKEILPWVEKTLDHKNPRDWYYALMDYGVYLAQTVENPNRKSSHYTKQSKFEGSLRQIRGEILRQLIQNHKLTEKMLIQKAIAPKEKIQKALLSLKNDNLIQTTGPWIKLS